MLVVLASYPKSGNTWLRRFIASYASGRKVPLNEMATIIPSDAAYRLWQPVMNMGDGTSSEDYLAARIYYYKKLAEQMEGKIFFLKSHSAFGKVDDHDLFNDAVIDRYIYIVRNPLDVLPSFAHHLGESIEETWKKMQTENLTSLAERGELFKEYYLSWNIHTRSWLSNHLIQPDKCLLLRYEDLRQRPITEFTRIINHIGLPLDENLLVDAIQWASFKAMKEEEAAGGFTEAAAADRPFFRKGQIGSGKEEVLAAIRDEMYDLLKPLIKQLGYESAFTQ